MTGIVIDLFAFDRLLEHSANRFSSKRPYSHGSHFWLTSLSGWEAPMSNCYHFITSQLDSENIYIEGCQTIFQVKQHICNPLANVSISPLPR